jgi:signal transduction histidine kinase
MKGTFGNFAQMAHMMKTEKKEEIVVKNSAADNNESKSVKQQTQPGETVKYSELVQAALDLNHDISNPLTSIIGNIELLLLKYPDMDEYMEKKLRVVLNESRRIEEIIKKLSETKKKGIRNYSENNGEKMIDVDRSNEKNGEENLS